MKMYAARLSVVVFSAILLEKLELFRIYHELYQLKR